MQKIILTSDNFTGEIIVEYDFNGYLIKYENLADLNEAQQKFFYQNFPAYGDKFNELIHKAQSIKVEHIPTDLSFDKIWEEYDYKIGKKDKTSQLWSKLSTGERIEVFKSIKHYDRYLALKKGLDKQYLETYLRNQQYLTDWKTLSKKLK
jgi:hypothetical protein